LAKLLLNILCSHFPDTGVECVHVDTMQFADT